MWHAGRAGRVPQRRAARAAANVFRHAAAGRWRGAPHGGRRLRRAVDGAQAWRPRRGRKTPPPWMARCRASRGIRRREGLTPVLCSGPLPAVIAHVLGLGLQALGVEFGLAGLAQRSSVSSWPRRSPQSGSMPGSATDWRCDAVINSLCQVTRAIPHQIHNNAPITSGHCCFRPLARTFPSPISYVRGLAYLAYRTRRSSQDPASRLPSPPGEGGPQGRMRGRAKPCAPAPPFLHVVVRVT